jgi:protein N-terminal methyltransferase
MSVEREAQHEHALSTTEQIAYWKEISADDNGMLGGYPQVSTVDIRFSRNFLRKLRSSRPTRSARVGGSNSETPDWGFQNCLEAGAGIGRVTLNLLSTICTTIDIIEPIAKFTAGLTADESPLVKSGQLRHVYNMPLQQWSSTAQPSFSNTLATFRPTKNQISAHNSDHSKSQHAQQYDLIFNQWCLTYLSTSDIIRYLRSLVPLLAEDGWIIVKENISTAADGADIFWDEDSSVTRSDKNFRAAFEAAGLRLVRTQMQTGYPEGLGLLPVRMYALRPRCN